MEAAAPSWTAMWHAVLRAQHADNDPFPIYSDTRSIELVSEEALRRVADVHAGYSQDALGALRLMAVIRYRVVADRLESARDRGIRQFVILGAGLDTSGFDSSLATFPCVFEVDHPATQEWKRRRISEIGWEVPTNLVFAPCDFESQNLLDALAAAGFERDEPAMVSLFGVILYLTASATKALLADLSTLAAGSEVTLSYSEPVDGSDAVAEEVFGRATPVVDSTGESFVGKYTEKQIDELVRAAGFADVIHYGPDLLNDRYFSDRSDGLLLRNIERLLTALVG